MRGTGPAILKTIGQHRIFRVSRDERLLVGRMSVALDVETKRVPSIADDAPASKALRIPCPLRFRLKRPQASARPPSIPLAELRTIPLFACTWPPASVPWQTR